MADPSQPTDAQQSNPVIDALRAKNYDMSAFSSDADLIPYLEQAAQNAQDSGNMQQMAQYGQTYLEHAGDFQEYLKNKAAPQEQAPDPLKSAPSPTGNNPEYDPGWDQVCDFDPQSRRYVVKPAFQGSVNLTIADKLTTARNWETEQMRKMTREFPDMVKQHLPERDTEAEEKRIQELVDARISETLQGRDEAQQAYSYLQDNADKLYELKDGQPVTDPQTGQWKMTDRGHLVMEYAQRASASKDEGGLGLSGFALQQYADKMADADLARWQLAEYSAGQEAPQQGPPSPGEIPPTPDSPIAAPLSGPEQSQTSHDLGEQLKDGFVARSAREAEKHGSSIENSDANRSENFADQGALGGGNTSENFRKMLETDFADAGLLPRTG